MYVYVSICLSICVRKILLVNSLVDAESIGGGRSPWQPSINNNQLSPVHGVSCIQPEGSGWSSDRKGVILLAFGVILS